MALAGTESWTVVPGFVADADGNLSVTTDGTGASWREGFLRDPDGRLVVAESAGTWQGGLVRDEAGALCVTTGAVAAKGTVVPGLPTNEDGLICVANDGTPARGLYPGFMFDGGKLCVTGLVSATPLYEESFTAVGVAAEWTTTDTTVTRITTDPHSAPGSLAIEPDSFAPTALASSPIFDASEITNVEFYAKRVGDSYDNITVGIVECDSGGGFLAAHIISLLTPSFPTSWTQVVGDPVVFTEGGVKAYLAFGAEEQDWDGIGFVVDDVLVEGTA